MYTTDLWTQLKNDDRPIVLYGMNNIAEKVAAILKENGREISGVMVSDGFVRDKEFLGFKLKTLAQLEEELSDFVILMCFGSHDPDVIDYVKGVGKKHPLFSPDLPVVGDGFFDLDYYRQNGQSFAELSRLLADDESRRVLQNVIDFKLSGNQDFLFDCQSSDEETWRLAIDGAGCTDLLDLGAYTGDTAGLFERLEPRYASITAVEPEERNFRKLCGFAEGRPRINCINAGIGDKEETVAFPKGSGRGSGSKKYKDVRFTTVDALMAGLQRDGKYPAPAQQSKPEGADARVQGRGKLLIKMDLEGWEEKAIRGAEKTIKEYRPTLLIAAYHKTEDLLAIPKQVLDIFPGYRVYLRRGSCIPAWELNYIFVPDPLRFSEE